VTEESEWCGKHRGPHKIIKSDENQCMDGTWFGATVTYGACKTWTLGYPRVLEQLTFRSPGELTQLSERFFRSFFFPHFLSGHELCSFHVLPWRHMSDLDWTSVGFSNCIRIDPSDAVEQNRSRFQSL